MLSCLASDYKDLGNANSVGGGITVINEGLRCSLVYGWIIFKNWK